MSRGKKIAKWTGICLAIAIFIVCLPFLLLRMALSESVSNKILETVVPDFANAEARIGHIDYALLSSWPDVELGIKDITVISNVFEPADTLLHIDSIGVSVNAGDFLNSGDISINRLHVDDPHFYIKRSNGKLNAGILLPSDTAATDTAAFAMPDIFLRDIRLNGGRLRLDDEDGNQDLLVDNLFFSLPRAQYKFDSIMGGLELSIDTIVYDNHKYAAIHSIGSFVLNAKAAQIGCNVFTDININSPSVNLNDSLWKIANRSLDLYLRGRTDTTFRDISIVRMSAAIDSMSVSMGGKMKVQDDKSVYTDLALDVKLPEINDLLCLVPAPYKSYFDGLEISGGIDLGATAKGIMRKKDLPTIEARLQIKKLKAKYKQFPQGLDDLQLDMSAVFNDNHRDSSKISLEKLLARTGKTALSTNGTFGFAGGRGYIDWKLKTHLNLETVNNIYRIEQNQAMSGTLDADIKADFFLDDIKKKDFYKIFTQTKITGDDVSINLPEKKLALFVDSLRARLNTNTGVKNRRRTDTSLVNTRISFSAMDLEFDKSIKANADRFSVSLLADDLDSAKVPRFRISASTSGLKASVRDTMKLFAKKARASFNIRKDRTYKFLPNTSATISMDTILFSNPGIGAMLKESDMRLSIQPRFRRFRRNAEGKRERIPLDEQPIIDLRALTMMFDTIGKADDKAEMFLKEFGVSGNIKVKSLRAKSPTNPIRMAVNRVNVDFTDDTLHLNNLTLRYGRSRIKLSGDVNNIRRFLLRGRTLSADLSLTSKRIDVNQILRSLYMSHAKEEEIAGDEQSMKDSVTNNMDDLAMDISETQEEAMSEEAIDSTVQASLIVLPKNLNIKFGAKVDTVKFGRMNLCNFMGDVSINKSALRLKQLSTSTQLGNAALNVMYECKSNEKANAALSLEMDSVQVGDIVHYFPELDSIMPMLRSFSGSVAAEASASLDLDSTMNIDLPSVNAGLYLRGDSLTLMDGETFSEIAKILMFNKKTKNRIDSVSVELLVRNNEIEIYPFMVGMDKYRLGVGGTQGLDGSFDYHIVLLKSPLLFRIGLDVYGTDFDHIKFRLASPKFKNFNVSIGKGGTLINNSKVNLRKSFHDAMVKTITEE